MTGRIENLYAALSGRIKPNVYIYCDYTDATKGYSEQKTKIIWKELKTLCPHIANEIKVWKEVFGEIRLTRWRKK